MTPAHLVPIIVLVVVAVGLRLRRRARRARPTPSSGVARPRPRVLVSLLGVTGLVASREVRERIRGRVFRVGTVLILAGVAAAIVIPVLNRGKAQPVHVGLVNGLSAAQEAAVTAEATALGTTVVFVPEATVAGAEADLRSGRIDLAIVDAARVIVNKPVTATDSSATAGLVRAVAATLGEDNAAAAIGLSPAQVAAVAHAPPLPVTSLQGGAQGAATKTTSVVGLILVFVMLTQYNTWTLIGVMEEKSSRVVEVLLAAVRPMQLLAGKVLGIGIVALGQASLVVVVALVLAKITGSDLLHGTAPVVLLSTLLWLVLGYAFYCWVYAAAGAMAERQDQVQTLALPISLPVIFAYVISLTTAESHGATLFFKVLAYLPPTAPLAMPTLVGLGAVNWWEFTASCIISVAATAGVARLAAVIYRRAILRTGRRVRLREVIGAGA